jgi:N-acetylglucosaminyldiphosphoundecaprenol N-acetyl-beta-D-mannosaminyltransferase
MEAYDSPVFTLIMNEADLVTPDGMPVVWGLRLLGVKEATRVYGPDLMLEVLDMAGAEGVPIGLHGGSPETVQRLTKVLSVRFPQLQVPWVCSPPFSQDCSELDEAQVNEINQSGAKILFVGLGSPKQERWIAAHRGRIQAVMIGVGAAFDFLSGSKAQAPRWMMRMGLEWLFRLISEPRRLWKRYLKQNPRFVVLFAMQLLQGMKLDEVPDSRG